MSSDSSDDKGSKGRKSGTTRKLGGTARKAAKPNVWRRMIDWIAPPEGDDTVSDGRLAVQVVLPDGARLTVVARCVNKEGGVMELEVEPAPTNAEPLVAALAAAAHGRTVAPPKAAADPMVDDFPAPSKPVEDEDDFPAPSQPVSSDDGDLPSPWKPEDEPKPTKVRPTSKPTEEVLPAPVPADEESELLNQPLARKETLVDGLDVEADESHVEGVDQASMGYGEIDLPGQTGEPARPFSYMTGLETRPPKDTQVEAPLELQVEHDTTLKDPAKARAKRPTKPMPKTSSKTAPVVGIDFGTSYSSVAVYREGEFRIVPDKAGEVQMPSVVSFPSPGEVVIGADARRRMAGEAQWTIASPKRLLGRPYKDPQVSQHIGGIAFRTFAGSDKFTRFEAHGEIYSVTDLCAMILKELRAQASAYLDADVTKAVFAVPVGHGSIQRSALELAAREAGLEVVGLLTEPSASVLSHGFKGKDKTLAVYDFGGGTFDFCVLKVRESAFQVLCAGGDAWLGGDDFDAAMGNSLADLFWNETGVDLRTRAVEWQALLFACEAAKRKLSKRHASNIRLEDLLFTSEGRKGLSYKMSRKEFAKLTNHLIEKSITTTDKVMAQANISPKSVDGIIMSGGTSLIPSVRDAVAQYFGTRPLMGDPDLAVTKGTALRAAELDGEPIDSTTLSGRTIKEVAGRTIGAGVKGDRVVTLIERDAPLPVEAHCTFYTQKDNQTSMAVGLFEESKSRIDESRSIGQLRYKGLKKRPAGASKIDFTFLLDEDGLLHVTASVEGKEYSKTIRLG